MTEIFKILRKDKGTKARLGILNTPHGTVKTPAYVMVATRGEIKSLKPSDIRRTGTQIVIANTYHLQPDVEKNKISKNRTNKFDTFLINRLGANIPTMTDSGGFQVFSLGFGHDRGAKKIFPDNSKKSKKIQRRNIRITNSGVYFKIDNREKFLGPEKSIKIQQKIGADIIFAFDELTYLFDSYKYTEKSLKKTHKWALECLKTHNKNNQFLYGITQGGPYKKLRIAGAKFIGSLPFEGFGIGGAYSKEGMIDVLKWTIPYLPEEKPRHLLGVGKIEDIFTAIENGVDTFDCVIPTREARHGRIWTVKGYYDIRKSKYSKDKKPLDKNCGCETCKKITRAKLRELFKNHDKLNEAQRYATIHNIYFFNDLVGQIRKSIEKNRFKKFKDKILAKTKKPR